MRKNGVDKEYTLQKQVNFLQKVNWKHLDGVRIEFYIEVNDVRLVLR